MALFFQIIGVLCCLLLLLVFAGVLLVRYKLRRLFTTLHNATEAWQPVPARLHLERQDTEQWQDRARVEEQLAPLRAAGFEDAGHFLAPQLQGLRLQGLVSSRHRLFAAVYEHPSAGVFTDLVARYADGTTLTYGNLANTPELDQRPGHGKVRCPGAAPGEMLERIMAERPDRPVTEVSPGEFAGFFERAYADEMDWRNSRGGPTAEEVRAVARASGEQVSEEVLEMTRHQLAMQALGGLEEGIRERFLASGAISEAEWDEVEHRVLVVHDRLTMAHAEELLEEEGETPETAVPTAGKTPREWFAARVARLPADRTYRLLGRVTEPVPADLYLAPD